MDGDLLFRAILEDPLADDPRLAYADWLMEQDDPVKRLRGEFIKIQCEHAHLTKGEFDKSVLGRRLELFRRGKEIHNQLSFWQLAPARVVMEPGPWDFRDEDKPFTEKTQHARIVASFVRGFVEHLRMPFVLIYEDGPTAHDLFTWQPIREIRFSDKEPRGSGNVWYWHPMERGYRVRHPHHEHHRVPQELFGGGATVFYPSRQAAINDLSRRVVCWGQQLAGLPHVDECQHEHQ